LILGTKTSIRRKIKPDNKPWYTKSCDEKRKQFNINRKKYNLKKSSENKQLLTKCGREYKKEMNKSYNEYAKKFETQLRNASKTDTKKVWKILKSFSKNKNSEENKISLDRLYEYFKELNSSENEASSDDFSRIYFQNGVDLLISEITEDEVIKAAKNLKNSKAPGLDDIINEYLKTTVTKCLPYYVKLFNLIFGSGESPDSWTLGIIKVIYKNKGDPNDPDNYRAITLVSSLGKLFTSILNSRLSNFLDETDLVTKSQAGFRAGYSTQDNIHFYSL
jgi:bisphosphoglycerate-dependent phosphoglycerate mutase